MSLRCLHFDDEPKTAVTSLRRILTVDLGFEVMEITDFDQALDFLQKYRFDFLLSDLMDDQGVPGPRGLTLVNEALRLGIPAYLFSGQIPTVPDLLTVNPPENIDYLTLPKSQYPELSVQQILKDLRDKWVWVNSKQIYLHCRVSTAEVEDALPAGFRIRRQEPRNEPVDLWAVRSSAAAVVRWDGSLEVAVDVGAILSGKITRNRLVVLNGTSKALPPNVDSRTTVLGCHGGAKVNTIKLREVLGSLMS